MPDLQTLDCFQPGLAKLERVAYFNRMLLTADDMRTDQDWVVQKLRRHNRFLHGWGVVCGLLVTAAPTATQPWRVQVTAGYALGPFGDEIFVGEPVFMDLAQCGPGAVTNPCEPSILREPVPATGPLVYLGIKYAECKARPVLSMPAGCACEDLDCEYSRVRDSFEIECLRDLPASHVPDPNAPSLCDVVNGKAVTVCPPCPTEPWVVLAKVTLPASPTAKIADTQIDNKPPVRRLVFSTAMIQQQLIACCCTVQRPRLQADLQITKKVDRVVLGPGPLFVYTITVKNNGPAAADNVVVEDELSGPPHTATDFQPPEDWVNITGPVFVARRARLEPGDGFRVTYAVESRPGTLTNTAKVRSDTDDPDPSNNSATTTTQVG